MTKLSAFSTAHSAVWHYINRWHLPQHQLLGRRVWLHPAHRRKAMSFEALKAKSQLGSAVYQNSEVHPFEARLQLLQGLVLEMTVVVSCL